jgi:aryl-alcohol dehydrogenase-like predicted oxidoreductase
MKLGFGAWQLGGECTFGGRQTGWGKLDLTEALKTLEQAVENGITFFDTAPGYGKGQSEKLLGSVFSQIDSSKIKVCTKYGSFENESGESYLDFSQDALYRSVEESLKGLKLTKLDTVLLHSPPDDFDFQNFDISPFEKLKSQGIISHYGVSVRSLKGAVNVLNSGFGDTLEAIFNVLDRRSDEIIFPNPNFKKYWFIARVPLASGILSEKFLLNTKLTFSETDIRSSISESDRKWYAESVEKLSFLNDLPGGISVSALRYVLHHPKVDFVIPGTRNLKHLNSNLLALEFGPLSAEIQNRIKETLPTTNPNWIPKSR